jgi:hypothetical protein
LTTRQSTCAIIQTISINLLKLSQSHDIIRTRILRLASRSALRVRYNTVSQQGPRCISERRPTHANWQHKTTRHLNGVTYCHNSHKQCLRVTVESAVSRVQAQSSQCSSLRPGSDYSQMGKGYKHCYATYETTRKYTFLSQLY